jgi:hypothetical protein
MSWPCSLPRSSFHSIFAGFAHGDWFCHGGRVLEITPQQRNENGSLLRAISSSFCVPFLDMVISALLMG